MSSSTRPLPLRSTSGRSSTAPTSSCIPRRSTWPATPTRSPARSSHATPPTIERLWQFRQRTGPTCAADVAALVSRGIKTLRVRVERQTETAGALAERLRAHQAVETVRYPGFGGLLSFDVAGDPVPVERALRVIRNATSLGGVGSTMESRHRWEGDRVPVGLLRLSVGLEDVDELWADLEQALATVG